ncbi:hypothetical protein [Phytopseudomonas daroniae]|uniref:hypothetical protein n=1 Tax=Phytopseudomonas daroniae TaxID=2487519 RepID=UPI001FC9B2F4|nr:hypothetical protein [Pseudomonas daroniae]
MSLTLRSPRAWYCTGRGNAHGNARRLVVTLALLDGQQVALAETLAAAGFTHGRQARFDLLDRQANTHAVFVGEERASLRRFAEQRCTCGRLVFAGRRAADQCQQG